MAIRAQGKLKELRTFNKTDGSIQNEYNNANYQYQEAKEDYKESNQEYKFAQKQLETAKEKVKDAPFRKRFKAKRNERKAKRNFKLKKQRYLLDRQKYKRKLKELRRLKNEIRRQYKSHKEYIKFFSKVKEATKMGIILPKYITDEYTKQKSTYLSEKYEVDKTGRRKYLTQPDMKFSKDVSTLIWEKKQQNMKDTVQKNVTRVKTKFASKGSKSR